MRSSALLIECCAPSRQRCARASHPPLLLPTPTCAQSASACAFGRCCSELSSIRDCFCLSCAWPPPVPQPSAVPLLLAIRRAHMGGTVPSRPPRREAAVAASHRLHRGDPSVDRVVQHHHSALATIVATRPPRLRRSRRHQHARFAPGLLSGSTADADGRVSDELFCALGEL